MELRFGAEGVVDHGFAEIDELAAQLGIVDGTAVFARVDDAYHRGQQLREISGAADFLEHARVLELHLERHRVSEMR